MRRLLLLTFALALAAPSLGGGPAQASQSCATYEDCQTLIESGFYEYLNQDALEGSLINAANQADPPENMAEEPAAEDPPKPKPGTAGDLIKAIIATDPIKTTLSAVKDEALAKVQSDWEQLRTGQKVGFIAWTLPIATATVTTIIADPKLLKPTQDILNGAASGALGLLIPGAGMKFDLLSPNKTFILQLDVAKLLQKLGVKFNP